MRGIDRDCVEYGPGYGVGLGSPRAMVTRAAALALLLAGQALAAPRVKRPNIIFIMSDDQDGNDKQDWSELMPKLKLHFQDGGARFNAHVADAPQCGPSRSSTLTGRAVHNTKFWINADPTRTSFANYAQVQNQTIGTFLTGAGYHTAFLGKYVNGFECVPNPVWEGRQTWSYWYATCNTYVLYNSSYVTNAGELVVHTGEYQTDTLGKQAIAQMGAAKQLAKPFYVHITPVAPHASTCYNPGPERMLPWCEERGGRWYCDKDPAAVGPHAGLQHCAATINSCSGALAPVDGGRDCCNCTQTDCSAACKAAFGASTACEAVLRCPEVCPQPDSLTALDDWANSFTGEDRFPHERTYAPPSSACGTVPGSPCCRTADATESHGCPCVRKDHCEDFSAGAHSSNPHQPQWNKSMAGFPSFLDLLPPINDKQGAPGGSEDVCYRQRLRSVQATDDMIDDLVKALTSMELLQTTYMFYTADNGYHLGEHRLPVGKCEPFESDVHLTNWVRGPGITPGMVSEVPTQHTDYAATFLELAGVKPPAGYYLDGHSMVPTLLGASDDAAAAAAAPREYTFSEFFLSCSTWRLVRLAKYTDTAGVSRRLAFHAWCTNQTEAYDLDADPYQLNDLSVDLPAQDLRRLTAMSDLLGGCAGADCSAPLKTLVALADARVVAALGAMDSSAVRLGENIPTGLACYHGSRVNTWCCGAYNCADREPPGAVK
jgi:arylsulfatase A-like enzyme